MMLWTPPTQIFIYFSWLNTCIFKLLFSGTSLIYTTPEVNLHYSWNICTDFTKFSISSLVRCLFRSFAHFKIRCFVFRCWWIWRILCIFWSEKCWSNPQGYDLWGWLTPSRGQEEDLYSVLCVYYSHSWYNSSNRSNSYLHSSCMFFWYL